MAAMRVTVLLFAILRERAGRDQIELSLPEGATVAQAIEALRFEDGLADVIGRLPVRMAVNREYADSGVTLAPGDELALVPPVSGGSEVHVRVGEEPLSIERLSRMVGRPSAGAIVCFQGTTREVPKLEYEAYAEMAEERLAAILTDCVERHGLAAAAVEHRTGPVPLGEASVVVAVAAAHREGAFAGAREAIDRIKAEAPIWKREVDQSGSRWVEGTVP
jgi:molybdopterin synthase catalytic subunit/molybdopterin converting factor small subunit